MQTLTASNLAFRNINAAEPPSVALVSSQPNLPMALRAGRAYVTRSLPLPEGYGVYLLKPGISADDSDRRCVALPEEFAYLADGDIIRLIPKRGSIRTLFRRTSPQNFLLLTERCNNYCLMCSQPPKSGDDSWIADEMLDVLPLIDRSTEMLTLTGGEPTLLGNRFFAILSAARSWLPSTSLQILTNGRRFADSNFTQRYAAVGHSRATAAIPLYSDLSTQHDYVVQSAGAYDETIRGILNLKRLRQRVEIRVVLHKQTYARLPQLAEFITRNLLFVDHVALMGLEITGFTRANLPDLWIDPVDYQTELREAVERLTAFRVPVSIYNHPLCLLDPATWPYARKSISDWKNMYFGECSRCSMRERCGGFFASARLRHSDHIKAFA